MSKRNLETRLLGVDGDEETNSVVYYYGVFDADEDPATAEPIREIATTVKF